MPPLPSFARETAASAASPPKESTDERPRRCRQTALSRRTGGRGRKESGRGAGPLADHPRLLGRAPARGGQGGFPRIAAESPVRADGGTPRGPADGRLRGRSVRRARPGVALGARRSQPEGRRRRARRERRSGRAGRRRRARGGITVIPERYDVVVVGAGLAGLQCAKLLGREGLSVLLADARPSLERSIHTTGIFVRKTLEDFDFPASCLGPPVREVILYSPARRALRLASRHDEFRIGRMGALYAHLLEDCRAAGVDWAPATRYTGSEASDG